MLTERQKMILTAIVDDYIRSAEPVGSRSISKRGIVGYSPATIRNEMSDLEEMGYLEQPHTSAGRIPSQSGYRYYVDNLIQLGFISNEELGMIRTFFAEKINMTEQIVQQVAMILSNLTNYTSIVLGPEVFNATLRHIQLIPLNQETAVAIIVTNTGHVENRTVSIPPKLPMSQLEVLVNILNAKLKGVPLLQLRSKLYTEIASELRLHVNKYEEILHVLEDLLESDHDEKVYHSGMTNMLNQPEFKDVEKVRTIFDLFDQSHELAKLLSNSQEGIQVKIGAENHMEAMSHCSLITATYMIEGQSIGTIGVLGPTRMDYGRVINILDYLSKDLSLIYAKLYK